MTAGEELNHLRERRAQFERMRESRKKTHSYSILNPFCNGNPHICLCNHAAIGSL